MTRNKIVSTQAALGRLQYEVGLGFGQSRRGRDSGRDRGRGLVARGQLWRWERGDSDAAG